MPFDDGWAALNLEMSARVPRTEYSVEHHWPLISQVTGITVSSDSDTATQERAQREFRRAWKFDLQWSTLISRHDLGAVRSYMGHAEYLEDGSDFDTAIVSAFEDPEEALAFDPWESYGPIDQRETTRRFEEHYKANCERNPDAVNMTGVYVSCVSGLIEIFGWEMLLLAAGVDGERFGRLTERYADWSLQFFEALAEADVPVVMLHDDIVWSSGPFIQPEWYREYVFPAHTRQVRPLLDSGKKVLFTADGDYTMFVDDIAAVGVHGFVLEPLTDLEYVAERYGETHAIIGNADTRILLRGVNAEIRAEVERCMAIGKECPGFIMAVGNHIPSNTPVESALYYNDVYEELAPR